MKPFPNPETGWTGLRSASAIEYFDRFRKISRTDLVEPKTETDHAGSGSNRC